MGAAAQQTAFVPWDWLQRGSQWPLPQGCLVHSYGLHIRCKVSKGQGASLFLNVPSWRLSRLADHYLSRVACGLQSRWKARKVQLPSSQSSIGCWNRCNHHNLWRITSPSGMARCCACCDCDCLDCRCGDRGVNGAKASATYRENQFAACSSKRWFLVKVTSTLMFSHIKILFIQQIYCCLYCLNDAFAIRNQSLSRLKIFPEKSNCAWSGIGKHSDRYASWYMVNHRGRRKSAFFEHADGTPNQGLLPN